jgi:hypothetical protein
LQGKAADIHCDNLDYAKVIFDILRQNKYVAYTYIGRASPNSSVANEGFAPLCGAAAISMAALKTPVASPIGREKQKGLLSDVGSRPFLCLYHYTESRRALLSASKRKALLPASKSIAPSF